MADAPVPDVIRIIDNFRQPGRSLLMPPSPVALDALSVIDISHESLIRGWRRLRKWAEQEAESAKIYRRLAETATLHELGTAGLFREPDLTLALEWCAKEKPTQAWAGRYHPGFVRAMDFLEKSRQARALEERQKERERRRTVAVSLGAAVVLGAVAVVAVLNWRTAATERDRAERARMAADVERDRARESYATTTELASTLVFDIVRDTRLRNLDNNFFNGIYDRAIGSYGHVIRVNPTAPAYNGRGVAYAGKKDLDKAIADYDRAIQLDANFDAAYVNRGRAYAAKTNHNRAIADYDRAIEIRASAPVHTFRGDAYLATRNHERALIDYDRAIQLDPTFAAAYNGRGNVYFAKDEFDRAIGDYDIAILLDPNSVYTTRDADLLDYENELDDRRARPSSRELQLDVSYSSPYHLRGRAYAAKKDHDRAIADFNRAIELDPKDALSHRGRGFSYSQKNENDRAIADYDRAIELDSRYVAAYITRGNAYSNKRDYDRAIADYDRAIELDSRYASGLLQPRPCLLQQARLRPRHRRLRSGDRVRSALCLCL